MTKDLQSLCDSQSRRATVKRLGFYAFCFIYLPHHFNIPAADFHWTLMEALDDPRILRLEIIGFRGSAKSTIASLAYPIYEALEHPDIYSFILPVSDTGTQSATNIANIKNELENNELIKQDYGVTKEISKKVPNPEPSLESDEEWQSKNMLLSNGVRILARSRGQKVRGLKHRQHRPKLIIVDDPEDLEWVRQSENRIKTETWLDGEVLPSIDERTGKLILIGNYLHDDALMARKKKKGMFRVFEFPLIDQKTRRCTWPAKYPTKAVLDLKRKELGETAWSREMLLKVIAEEGQDITEKDIHYYDKLPQIGLNMRRHGVDLAISEKQTADFTAMVSADVYDDPDDYGHPKIYILPNPFHKRCPLPDLEAMMLAKQRSGGGHMFYVEKAGYQEVAIQDMERHGIAVQRMIPGGDKVARRKVIAKYIKNGTVKFPVHGCEDLISEMINFGVEAHDDLNDACVYLLLGLQQDGINLPEVWSI